MNREAIRTWAEIDSRAMRHSLQIAREKTGIDAHTVACLTAAICWIRDLPHLKIGRIFTHFAVAAAARRIVACKTIDEKED